METSNTVPLAPPGHKPIGEHNPNRMLAVVSRKTGQLRRIIDDDDDTAYEKHHETAMHSGEMAIYVHPNDYKQYIGEPLKFHDHVARLAGFKERPHWSTTRHAVVSPRGEIMNIIEADPSCGDLGEHLAPGHTLLQHPTAEIGMIVFDDGKVGGLVGRNHNKPQKV
jgi:hypothetical protein